MTILQVVVYDKGGKNQFMQQNEKNFKSLLSKETPRKIITQGGGSPMKREKESTSIRSSLI